MLIIKRKSFKEVAVLIIIVLIKVDKASFCLGNCSNGVSMKVDDEFVQNANPGNIEQIFNEQIKTKL